MLAPAGWAAPWRAGQLRGAQPAVSASCHGRRDDSRTRRSSGLGKHDMSATCPVCSRLYPVPPRREFPTETWSGCTGANRAAVSSWVRSECATLISVTRGSLWTRRASPHPRLDHMLPPCVPSVLSSPPAPARQPRARPGLAVRSLCIGHCASRSSSS